MVRESPPAAHQHGAVFGRKEDRLKRFSKFGALALGGVAAAALLGSALAFAGPQNGSFEDGATNIGGFMPVSAGSSDVTGWTVEAAVDYIGTYWTSADGSRSLDMNATAPGSAARGSVSQVLNTVVGATYDVSFALSGNPACDSGAKVLRVEATGAPSADYTFNTATEGNSTVDMKWRSESYSFVATGASSTLSFASQSDGNCGPALDDVSVTETLPPVPASAGECKKGGWQSLTDHMGNGFKNQGDCVSYVATQNRNLGAIAP